VSVSEIVLEGTLKPDGTLELDQKPTLRPGRVRVVLSPVESPPAVKEDTWTVLQRIWKEQQARGFKGRTKEEIDADVNALREELEEHANEVERLQTEAQKARENRQC
jgi:hypothetical protein